MFLTHSATQLFRDSSQMTLSNSDHNTITKRIVIVGAGPSGVSTLHAFLTGLPEETRKTWQIVVFEKRDDVGGIWYEESQPVHCTLIE